MEKEQHLVPIDNSPIFKDSLNLALIKNIILIDKTIETPDIFFSSNSNDTLPICYNYYTDRDKLFEYLEKEFVNLNRIGFIFNNSMMNSKYFLNNEVFFTENDLIQFKNDKESLANYSNNVTFLIKLIKRFDIKHVDFLACNSLEYADWKKYYELLQYHSSAVIGASKDLTGNINYGANWIMENTNEDIQHTYFNENITNYSSTLASSSITYYRTNFFGENFFSINVKNVFNKAVTLNNLSNLVFSINTSYTPLNPTKNYVLYYRNILNNTFISVTDITNMNIIIYPGEQYEFLAAFQNIFHIVFGMAVAPNTLLSTDNVLSLYSGKSGLNNDPNAYNTLSPNAIYNSLYYIYQLSYTLNYTYTPDKFWEQVGEDINGEALNDLSSTSVSLSDDGKTVAIGAPNNGGKGHVRVYKFSDLDKRWIQIGEDIDGEEAGDESGILVSLSADGKIVAIGARYNDGKGSDSGHTRVYKFSDSDKLWKQMGQDIDGEAAGDLSGRTVSLSSDGLTVAIGALNNDGNGSDSGQVRVYKFSDSDKLWKQMGQDIDGEAAGDWNGRSVSLSSDGLTVAMGAFYNDGNGSDSGQVRVYTFSDSNKLWIQVGQDIDGEEANDTSGVSVSLSDDGKTVAIGSTSNGSTGHARVYKFSDSDKLWKQMGQDIDGEGQDDWSGYLVSLSSDGLILAIGAPFNGNKGYVRVYKFSESDKLWKKLGGNINGESAGDLCGWGVSLNSNGLTVAVGSRSNNDNGNDSGNVRVYTLVSSKKTLSELLNTKSPASEIVAAGYNHQHLTDGGFTASIMRSNGYDAKDLKLLDYSVRQMKQARFSLSSLLRARFRLGKITAYYGADKFLALGIDEDQLRKRGVSEERLKEMGFPIDPISSIAP